MSGDIRRLITRFYRLNWSARETWELLFESEQPNSPHLLSLNRVSSLFSLFRNDFTEVRRFEADPAERTGRLSILSVIEKQYLLQLIASKRFRRVKKLWIYYRSHFHINIDDAASYCTVWRFLKRARYSMKVIDRRHIMRNDIKRLQFLQTIEWVDPNDFVDIDETATSSDQFLDSRGWAKIGQRFIKTQIIIGLLLMHITRIITVITNVFFFT